MQVSPASATLLVGQPQQMTAAALSAAGAPLAGRSVTWTSSSGTVATVTASGLLTAVAAGTTTITATSEGRVGSAAITVLPVPVASVVVSPAAAVLLVGQTLQLAAATRDSVGGALSGRDVTWSSGDVARATVSGSGLMTALAPGTVTLTATSEGRSGTTVITVRPVPVASVTIAAVPPVLPVGHTLPLSAVARDSVGNVLAGRTLTWSSSDATRAVISASGVLTTLAAGSLTIAATSEGKTGTVAVTVSDSRAPVVVSVSPTALVPGQTVTLSGAGFAAVTTDNRVTVQGVAATVLTATPTQLTMVVPCVSSGAVAIRVATTDGGSVPLTAALTVPTRTLARGESLILTAADASACNELTAVASARYLVVVSSAGTSPNTLTDFVIAGNTPPPGGSALRIPAAPPSRVAATDEATRPDASARRDAAHLSHLERERALYASLHASGAFRERGDRSRGDRRSGTTRAVAPPAVGDMRAFYYNYSGCADSTKTFRARAIYIGARAVIWEDSANTLQSSADSALAGYYGRIGTIFDTDQYEAIRSTFGDPLRRDAQLDNDGRIQMVFTQQLNGTGAAAYVTSCDQSVRNTTNRAASNVGELFYGTVPTTAGSNVNSTAFADGWFYFMTRTVVHEVKHIASLSARVANTPRRSNSRGSRKARPGMRKRSGCARRCTAWRGEPTPATAPLPATASTATSIRPTPPATVPMRCVVPATACVVSSTRSGPSCSSRGTGRPTVTGRANRDRCFIKRCGRSCATPLTGTARAMWHFSGR